MIRFQFNQFKGTITQALNVVKSVEINDFWTLDMSFSTLNMSVSTLDMLLSTLDNYPDSPLVYIAYTHQKEKNNKKTVSSVMLFTICTSRYSLT